MTTSDEWVRERALAAVRKAGPVVQCRADDCDPQVDYGPLLKTIVAALQEAIERGKAEQDTAGWAAYRGAAEAAHKLRDALEALKAEQDKAVAAERERCAEAQRQFRIVNSHYRQQHDANLANLKRAEAAEAKLARTLADGQETADPAVIDEGREAFDSWIAGKDEA